MLSLANKISNVYPSLNKTSKLIADSYFKEPRNFLNKNLQELGVITKTSGASVIRFCKNLGFKGFKDFQIACAQEIPNKQDNVVDTIINENDDPTSILYKLQISLGKNIVDIGKTINHTCLNSATKLMQAAPKVYIAGEGASGLAAQDLFYKLIRSGKNVNYVQSSHIAMEQTANIEENDVLIIFSYSGLTQEPLLMAEQAQKNHAKIIAVTRSQDSPLTKMANTIIALPSNEKLLRYGAINSLFAEIFVSSLLYLSLILPNLEKLNVKMKATQKLTNQLKVDND